MTHNGLPHPIEIFLSPCRNDGLKCIIDPRFIIIAIHRIEEVISEMSIRPGVHGIWKVMLLELAVKINLQIDKLTLHFRMNSSFPTEPELPFLFLLSIGNSTSNPPDRKNWTQ